MPTEPTTFAAQDSGLPDWGRDVPRRSPTWLAAACIALPAVVAGAAAALFSRWAVLPAAAIAGGITFFWLASRGRGALGAVAARPLDPEAEPRLGNLVAGLAGDLGLPPPRLWLIPGGGPNALVTWTRGPQLAVTGSLLDTFARTELEAVVAHALVRFATGEAKLGALGRGSQEVLLLDLQAAAVTRYPPALAAAIRKCEPRPGRLWFVSSDATAPSPDRRAEELADL